MAHRGVKVMLLAAPAMALALFAAGCGGGGDGSANGGGAYGGSPATTAGAAPATTAATAAPGAAGTDVAGMSSVDVTMRDDAFVPSVLRGTPGQTVMLTLDNTGTQEHNFSLEAQKVDTDVEVGETATVKVTFPASGTLGFFCEYHQALGMTGSLKVPAS
ncbi:MAG TPA: cupredoxin domain-containing protein [Miltoncostaeaceae bacterium]|jgi:plastocyanin|nr:cupredoxin domain-containing protein [Miltoncostaeaceae bacterium]